MNSDDDLALQTLLAVRAEIASTLDEETLRLCYEIQKKYQFNDDRAQSMTAIERIIDQAVADLSNVK